ncbi:AraC-like DNA-binding protein [Parabacteroides sp. PF5-5]|uniref:AraC family transcriptional regulator n=1 Tax=unclassified Parabacteroides TaxID=2649774 RepID=UPI002474D387|nr:MULTISPECIES: AraC family transcriptional regulator [unclassified Parabacteroides]MDH6303779.1 AraC-like DNA-binding protein [Parabacteroides sp. PH5-39]MDH6314396.1 AraC-like DNA-binding protein [Parabacteroides sp. PF5-13]MDH6318539.1 AraC-like DNA-binding protein [Parabacteroides sp. PH5-13]MDH6322168.1 AraC-like DNA-binding protein [Parabacteroides sp. PH5-8]MDH6325752.1 AraC-like DNA-binding protein [Parabacteroides sp. PH5-41]
MNKQNDQLRYLTISNMDEDWGIVVTTVGYQFVPPKGRYPLSRHPEDYDFKPQNGRILNEYQLVYITKGSGYFSSQSCPGRQKISTGTMILLFPGEWHSYYPDPETGWDEYWVGFRGPHIDRRVEKQFFNMKEPLHHIGLSATIVGLYNDILKLASLEKAGYQQMISSIVLHILGSVYYKKRNISFTNAYVVDKINEARILMKEQTEHPLSPEEIASRLGLGYSWFRRMFKEYTGVSPAQYQLQQKLLRAKELLTTTSLNISEIAYALKFENASQFSTFFKKKEGLTPSKFRERAH